MKKEGIPRVSIISPILNVEKYITKTLESILNQSFQDWELIIMDGQSKDRTLEIVNVYAKKDLRIRIYSEPDEGVAHAADKGYQLARGEFITIVCGQDGFLDKEWLQKCVDVFDKDPTISLVWGLSKMMADDGTLLKNYYDVGFDHLIYKETKFQIFSHLIKKSFVILRDILFGSSQRRRFLLRKFFSHNATLRTRLLLDRSFSHENVLQKEGWFCYWLNTGIPFSDQSMVVDRKVFLRCTPRYEKGSRAVAYVTDFYFNFNSLGYLSCFLPIYPVFVRWHPQQSGAWGAEKIHVSFEAYLDKVRMFRGFLLKERVGMVFVDRDGVPLSDLTLSNEVLCRKCHVF